MERWWQVQHTMCGMVLALECFWLFGALQLPSEMSSLPGTGGELGQTDVPASVESRLWLLIWNCMRET